MRSLHLVLEIVLYLQLSPVAIMIFHLIHLVAQEVLEQYEAFRSARQAGKPILGVTTMEANPMFLLSAPPPDAAKKAAAHAKFMAGIMDHLVKERGVFVLFIPHCIQHDSNDVTGARLVAEAMTSSS